jgi:hypothetical protein
LEDACAARNGAVWIVRFTVMPISLTGGRGGRCKYNRHNGDAPISHGNLPSSIALAMARDLSSLSGESDISNFPSNFNVTATAKSH